MEAIDIDGRDQRSVGREVDVGDVVGRAREGADDLAALHVDEAHIAVTRPSQQEAAVGRDREAIHALGRGDDAIAELLSRRPLQRRVGLGRVLRLDPADRQERGQLGALAALEDAIRLRPQPLAVGVGETDAGLLAERQRHDAEHRGKSERASQRDRSPAKPTGRGGGLLRPASLGIRQPLGRFQLAPVLLFALVILAPGQRRRIRRRTPSLDRSRCRDGRRPNPAPEPAACLDRAHPGRAPSPPIGRRPR